MKVKSTGEAVGLAALSGIIGVIGIVVGFVLAGPGEGWVSAFFAALGLSIAYPMAVWLWLDPVPRRKLSAVLLGAAAIADAWLIRSTLSERKEFLEMWDIAPSWLIGWVAMWLGWQVVALMAFRRRR